MTVAEAFNEFKSALELPDRQQRQAADAQRALRERIATHLYVPNSFLSGSYARHTKIHPLNDIDVMLVRNDAPTNVTHDGSGTLPHTALEEVVSAVQRAYPSCTVTQQSRSVNVQLPGLPFGFDLIPAWARHPDGYWIPDRETATWIPTHPEWHGERMTEANENCGGKLKPLIKMIKHWSRNNLDLMGSFHIELICKEVFATREIPNYSVGVAIALAFLGDYVGRAMMDPAYGGTRVDKLISADAAKQLASRITGDAQSAISAIQLENAGRDGEAIAKWKHIFINGFA